MTLDPKTVERIITSIKNNSNYDFSNYSRKSLNRRLTRIITEYKITVNELCIKLQNNKDFLEKVVKDITVNTTEFFRDPDLWNFIKKSVLPYIKHKKNINIWHAGCSNGQELYSMMILLAENNILDNANFYGSDLNTDIIQKAKNGKYKLFLNETFNENLSKVFDNSDKIKSKYFDINFSKDIVSIKPNLLKKPKYFIHDLVKQTDFTDKKFDIIFCRNVLIYFDLNLQNKIFRYFYEKINKNGFLIIGLHEAIFGKELKLFNQLKYQVYKKIK